MPDLSVQERARRPNLLRSLPRHLAASNRIPTRIVSHLADYQSAPTADQLREFLQRGGLDVLEVDQTAEAFLFKIALPSETVSLIPEENRQYSCPQVKFSRFASADVPFGTVLLNCLLPPVDKIESAEKIFAAYIGIMTKLSTVLGAYPVACYTGFKVETTELPHNLYNRGLRFFFGQPNFIETIRHNLDLCLQRPGGGVRFRDLYQKRVDSRCRYDDQGRLRPHPVLEDILPMQNGVLVASAPAENRQTVTWVPFYLNSQVS